MEQIVSFFQRLSPRERTALAAGTLVLVTLVAYSPALSGGFIWDDEMYLTRTPLIKAANGLYRFWFTTEAPDYYPLTSTSLWFEWRIWKTNPAGYHATNLLLHVASAVLLWATLVRLNIVGAWLAALIFAIHPINVTSVAWISERKNVLSMVFYLITILLYLRFNAIPRRRPYLLSLGAFLCALLSKTAVVMLPFVLVGCVWWKRGRIKPVDIWPTIPFFALSLCLGCVTVWFQYNRALGGHVGPTGSFLSHCAEAGWAVWFYLYKILLPFGLTLIYPRWDINPSNVLSYLPSAALLICFGGFWRYRKGWGRPFLFGLGYFVVTLFPVLGFFHQGFYTFSRVANHWLYSSMPGVISLVVGGMSWGLETFSPWLLRQHTLRLAALLVGLLALLTWKQCFVYQDNETLWRDTLARNPASWLADNNLGVALADRGEFDEAIALYRQALKLQPYYPDAHINLGRALAALGQIDEAIRHYREALRMEDNQRAHVYLGEILAAQGKHDEAILHYRESLRIQPSSAGTYNNLALSLAAMGKTDEAIAEYRKALQWDPYFAEAHNNLGLTLAAVGRFDEAVAEYREAIRLAPNRAGIYNNRGQALASQGKTKEAITSYEEALRVDPSYARAHYNLGVILTKQGRSEVGLHHLREAVRLNPDWPMAANKLAWILATHEDANFRNASEAIRLAKQLCQKTNYQQPEILATLAAAFAEGNQFPDAVRIAEKAIDTAQTSGHVELVARITQMLQLYRQGRAYREPPSF
jgi:tetratricopeptide (TPR) repeat protein